MYSVKEYLHEKAEESRHNETVAYLVFIAGAVFFVGGLLATISSSDNLKWFIFLPYNFTSSPASFLSLTLTLLGVALSVYGVVVGIFYSRKRTRYIQQLYQAHTYVEKSANTPKMKAQKKPSRKIRKALRKPAR